MAEDMKTPEIRNSMKFLSFLSSFIFLTMKFVRTYDLNVERINL